MDWIKKLFMVCASMLATYSFAGDQNVIYCPKQIDCGLSSCQLSDNKPKIWNNLISVPSGAANKIYKFSSVYFAVQYGSDKSGAMQLKKIPVCIYDAKAKIEVRIDDSISDLFNVTQVKTNDEQWKIINNNGFNFLSCSSGDPQSCPMIEAPEISLNEGALSNDVLHTIYFNWIDFKSNLVTYDQLIKKCGAVPDCLLKIQARDASGYRPAGSVTVDLSKPNVVTIKNIEKNPGIPCVFSKAKSFNLLVCH